MSVSPGTRIGSYEVTGSLGAGGMGEVYRARDSKLKREVALKVLPAEMAGDAERLARFQREAEVLASLNHPHIAQIYGLEEIGGGPGVGRTMALVMELVEGEDLATRLERGAIPIDEALPMAAQIADALEGAHDHGIIHRDLKPANVKVRADGTLKVLDFGLAKAVDRAPGRAFQTVTTPAMTQAGVILGTAAYMSPEQARGKDIDRRTDIWAFGCVLYEMLAGTRAFGGDTVTDVLASILKNDPDWTALPPGTPASIRRMLRRALAKDPKQRLRDIADARLEIGEPEIATASRAVAPARQPSGRWIVPMMLAALATGVAAGVWWNAGQDETVPWAGTRLGGPAIALYPRVSPDGLLVAFLAMVDGLSQVAVMKPGTGSWTVLTRDRTKGLAGRVAWSADGARIYYDRETDVPNGIYSVPALGGDERLLIENASAPQPLPDGSLLLLRKNADRLSQLHRLRPDTGELEPLQAVTDKVGGAGGFFRPLDEGRITFYGRAIADAAGQDQLHVLTLGSGQMTRVGPDLSTEAVVAMTVMARDRSILLSVRDGSAFRVVRVATAVAASPTTLLTFVSRPYLDASADGSLFLALLDRQAEVVRIREGRADVEPLAIRPTLLGGAVALPDGRYLITERLGSSDQVLIAAPGKEPTRLVETSENTSAPMTPLGADRVALTIGSAAAPDMAIVAVNSGRILTRLKTGSPATSLAASPDGKVIYATLAGTVMALPVDGGSPRTVGPADSVTVDPDTGDLIVKLDERDGTRLVRMSPAGGPATPIAFSTGDLRMVAEPLMPGSVRKGRLLLPVATADSWYWYLGLLDLQTGQVQKVTLNYFTDFHFATWAADGSIIGSGEAVQSTLWKFAPEGPAR